MIYVTVKYGKNESVDLALPENIPSQFLAEAIAGKLISERDIPCIYTFTRNSTRGKQTLSPAGTLLDAEIHNGSILNLVEEPLKTKKRAWLAGENSIRFHLRERNIIGRKSVKTTEPVDIELGPLARERVISRIHATLLFREDRCFLVDKSRNGTWVNGIRLETNKPIEIKNGDWLEFGQPGRGAKLQLIWRDADE